VEETRIVNLLKDGQKEGVKRKRQGVRGHVNTEGSGKKFGPKKKMGRRGARKEKKKKKKNILLKPRQKRFPRDKTSGTDKHKKNVLCNSTKKPRNEQAKKKSKEKKATKKYGKYGG